MIEIDKLSPPAPALTPELEWTLRAAFDSAPPGGSRQGGPELDPAGAWREARALGLAERIAARTPAANLPADLRPGFRRAKARAAAIAIHYETVGRRVARIAAETDSPIVFLKGLALVLSGAVAPGSRPFSDLDLLVPEARAETLFERLVADDFAGGAVESTEQHLPALAPPEGGSLEVHFALRGVRLRGTRSARFEDLERRHALVRLDGFPGTSFVPERSLLSAHVAVHGFQQHLLRPASYPLFRMVGDLIDLIDDASGWEELRRTWGDAIAHALTARSFAAIRELCELLRHGRLPDAAAESDSARLFHHLLAGALDDRYAASLGRLYRRDRIADALESGELGDYLGRKIRPIFGLPRKRHGS